MDTDPRFLILNPVKTDQATEFEAFVREVLQPAVEAHQPEIATKVRLWRASENEPGEGFTIFAFVAEGVASWEDLNLLPAFSAQYGDDQAQQLLETFSGFFVRGREWAAAWEAAMSDDDEGARQYGWQMQQVWP